ncbi:uncharacterized protein V1516DRAFT_678845 [Lipomyces oligophaga]|uniref:uncharacterized protein n=1 Tax=Lipomyces oligophaga TaxID=45792 RepID=UPI0034CE1B99
MSSTPLVTGSVMAEELQAIIGERLRREGFAEDESPFVSEFIIVMISNGKNSDQIRSELADLLGPDRFAQDFPTWLFVQLDILKSKSGVVSSGNEAPSTASSTVALEDSTTDSSQISAFEDQKMVDSDLPSLPTGPLADRIRANVRRNDALHRQRDSGSGITKNSHSQRSGRFQRQRGGGAINGSGEWVSNSGNRSFRNRQQNNVPMNLNGNGFSILGMASNPSYTSDSNGAALFVANSWGGDYGSNGSAARVLGRASRCRHWPDHDLPCKFPHPIEICQDFANGACPSSRGSCDRIHVGEDMSGEDAQRYVESGGTYDFTRLYEMGNPLFRERRRRHEMEKQFSRPQQSKTMWHRPGAEPVLSITRSESENMPICKFGLKCANKDCAYAHPTPANGSALVLNTEVCLAGLGCSDENCVKSHPSPASGDATMADGISDDAFDKRFLETCRYHPYCTNNNCKYRHPLSSILCRNGADCTRQDCMYTHPLSTPCRFGVSCTNSYCAYTHPDGKGGVKNKVWVASNPSHSVSERAFAVPDDAVEHMQVPTESGTVA